MNEWRRKHHYLGGNTKLPRQLDNERKTYYFGDFDAVWCCHSAPMIRDSNYFYREIKNICKLFWVLFHGIFTYQLRSISFLDLRYLRRFLVLAWVLTRQNATVGLPLSTQHWQMWIWILLFVREISLTHRWTFWGMQGLVWSRFIKNVTRVWWHFWRCRQFSLCQLLSTSSKLWYGFLLTNEYILG